MKRVLGLDPGTQKSAIVIFDGTVILAHEIMDNDVMVLFLTARSPGQTLVIEQVESFGMAVGREVFETVFWTGRFAQAWFPNKFERMPRRVVKQHICHTARATDANIRTELIDRFGGPEKAVGDKKNQGPLYGIKSHCWAALALAVTWHDQYAHLPEQVRSGIIGEF